MLKLVFLDLDNTLLNSQKTISFKTASMIKELSQKGIKFIINTGRLPYNVEYLSEFVDTSNLVCGNGSYIRIDNKLIYDRPCVKEDAYKIIDYSKRKSVAPRVFFVDGVYSFVEVLTLPTFKVEVLNEDNLLDKISKENVYKVCFINEDPNVLNGIADFVYSNLDSSIAELSNPRFIECHHRDANKGKGIDKVCELLNVDKDEVLAIGDNENDLSMFNRGYHSACPLNGSDSVKNAVEYISKFDCDNDTIVDIVKHFM